MAIQMLDDTDFRFGEAAPGGKMKVVAADFSYKTQKDPPPKSSGKDKQKIIKKTQKLNKYLLRFGFFLTSVANPTIQQTSRLGRRRPFGHPRNKLTLG